MADGCHWIPSENAGGGKCRARGTTGITAAFEDRSEKCAFMYQAESECQASRDCRWDQERKSCSASMLSLFRNTWHEMKPSDAFTRGNRRIESGLTEDALVQTSESPLQDSSISPDQSNSQPDMISGSEVESERPGRSDDLSGYESDKEDEFSDASSENSQDDEIDEDFIVSPHRFGAGYAGMNEKMSFNGNRPSTNFRNV